MGNENQSFLPELGDQEAPQKGPSWANPKWPLTGLDSESDLTQAMDPTAMKIAVKKAAEKAGKPTDQASVTQAAEDAIRAMLLIRTFRVRGHLASDLDPLGLSKRELPDDLKLEWHFPPDAMDHEIYVGGNLGMEWTTPRELYEVLKANYCGKVGLEYMHISDVEERRFLQERIEGPEEVIQFTTEGKQ